MYVHACLCIPMCLEAQEGSGVFLIDCHLIYWGRVFHLNLELTSSVSVATWFDLGIPSVLAVHLKVQVGCHVCACMFVPLSYLAGPMTCILKIKKYLDVPNNTGCCTHRLWIHCCGISHILATMSLKKSFSRLEISLSNRSPALCEGGPGFNNHHLFLFSITFARHKMCLSDFTFSSHIYGIYPKVTSIYLQVNLFTSPLW